jgi:hypothetical protein
MTLDAEPVAGSAFGNRRLSQLVFGRLERD